MAIQHAFGWVQVGECLDDHVWCSTCLLSTAFTFELWLLTSEGVHSLRQMTACPECRSRWSKP